MLDAVPGVGTRDCRLCRFVSIEDEIDRGVTDRVDSNLEPGIVGAAHLRLELIRRHDPETDVVGLSFVRCMHACRAATYRAVDEELGRTDAHPLVPEAGTDAE